MSKILVIDDEQPLREMVDLALSQRGFDILHAANGAEGIELARKTLPDLILCDVNMEKVDGYLTLSSLRSDAATASIPFILMTGLADNAGMRHGMELGADDYLPKPFTIEGLYAAVDARLKKARALREEAERKLSDLRGNLTLMLPHELRTPLNGILAYGEVLMSETGSTPAAEIREMGQVIHQSGKRLERLVENFLIYAQLELLGSDASKLALMRAMQTRNAAAVVNEHARRQGETAERSEDLRIALEEIPVAMSEEYLGRIVEELTQNAFKFSSRGTPVDVELCGTAEGALLTVVDRGRGFSTEHLTRIGAYMQFDRKIHEQQGLGLGLAIARRLSELHGGWLKIESERSVRTEVAILLPTAA